MRGGPALCIALAALAAAPVAAAPEAPPVARLAQSAASGAIELAREGRRLLAGGDARRAEQVLRQALALGRQELGRQDARIAYILDDLATTEARLGRLDEALTQGREALKVIQAAKGADSVEAALLANNHAVNLGDAGSHAEAAELLERAHRTLSQQRGRTDPATADAAHNLAVAYGELGQLTRSAELFGQVLEARVAQGGEASAMAIAARLDLAMAELRLEHADAAKQHLDQARAALERAGSPPELAIRADLALARWLIQGSRLSEAEQLLARLRREAGKRHEIAAQAAYNLGRIQVLLGQAIEAAAYFREAREHYEAIAGGQHPALIRTIHDLAVAYIQGGREAEARRLLEHAIGIQGKVAGGRTALLAVLYRDHAATLLAAGEPERALQQAERTLALLDSLDEPLAVEWAYALVDRARALAVLGRLDEAADSYQTAAKLLGEQRGELASDRAPSLVELAGVYRRAGRLEPAAARIGEALRILEKDSASTFFGLGRALAEKARIEAAAGNADAALATVRRASQVMAARLEHMTSGTVSDLGELKEARELFALHLELAGTEPGAAERVAELVEIAQYPHLTGTAMVLARMAARFGQGKGELARLVRAQQDAVEAYRARDRQFTELLAEGGSRDRADHLRHEMRDLDAEIRELDRQLAAAFPGYAELTRPKPVALTAVQQALRPKEALWLQVTAAAGTTVLLIRFDGARSARTPLTAGELARRVAVLRAQLDPSQLPADQQDRPPPFDTSLAEALYQDLLAPFAAELRGVEHLIMVSDGAMESLPPGILLASPPAGPPASRAELGHLDWLVRRHAVSILPSASALVALRRLAPQSGASEPFLGFGDPDFTGGAARERAPTLDAVLDDRSGVNLRQLREIPRLPETRGELSAIAASLGAPRDALVLGARASETRVKRSPLDRYRVIAFATHGLLAAETRMIAATADPALALSPPAKATTLDDGLLTASEVAQLRLDADWVLLSACNTASAGGEPGAEGLSGLARAFFYAGARALLVSHWYVETESAAAITTGTMRAFAGAGHPSKTEALRHTLVAMLDGKGQPHWTHPAFWAPFVLVGDGGD
jgi:CHAT domain-containing protein